MIVLFPALLAPNSSVMGRRGIVIGELIPLRFSIVIDEIPVWRWGVVGFSDIDSFRSDIVFQEGYCRASRDKDFSYTVCRMHRRRLVVTELASAAVEFC